MNVCIIIPHVDTALPQDATKGNADDAPATKPHAEADGPQLGHKDAIATTKTTSSSGAAPTSSRPWRTKDPERRLPVFNRMSEGGSVSPAYVPLPTITGAFVVIISFVFIPGVSDVWSDLRLHRKRDVIGRYIMGLTLPQLSSQTWPFRRLCRRPDTILDCIIGVALP